MKRHLNSTQCENTMRTSLVRNCIKYFPFGMNEQKQPVTFIDVAVHACTKPGTLGGHVYVCSFVLGYRFCLFLQFHYLILWYLWFLILCQTFLLNMSHWCKKWNLGIEPIISITEENRELQERIKSLNPLQIQINFVRDENSRISWECQRYQGIIVMISWECQWF